MKVTKITPLLMALLMMSLGLSSWAGDKSPEQTLAENLKHALPHFQIDNIKATPVAGIYQVTLNGANIIYSNADGSHIFSGDLFSIEVGGLVNLTEAVRSGARVEALAAVPSQQFIEYAPKQVKATVTVFTDVDCGYCRKLHLEMDNYHAKGIAIRYAAFPRGGVQSPQYQKMVSAWCADDNKAAMDALKNGQSLDPKTCANPVAQHYELGVGFGIRGTPALVLDDGTLIPGYVPADELAQRLEIN